MPSISTSSWNLPSMQCHFLIIPAHIILLIFKHPIALHFEPLSFCFVIYICSFSLPSHTINSRGVEILYPLPLYLLECPFWALGRYSLNTEWKFFNHIVEFFPHTLEWAQTSLNTSPFLVKKKKKKLQTKTFYLVIGL